MKVSDLITQINYELVNSTGEFTNSEILTYINKAYQLIYSTLVGRREELVLTGTGSFSTEDGVQSYNLTQLPTPITDLWAIGYLWVTGYSPMEKKDTLERFSARNDYENDNSSKEMPQSYCLIGNTIWFTEVPDDVYEINLEYYPVFTPITDENADTPLNGLFDEYIVEMAIMIAKNRNDMGSKVDALLLGTVQTIVDKIVSIRRDKNIHLTISPNLSGYYRRNRML